MWDTRRQTTQQANPRFQLLCERRIATRNYCYACTVGPGSSCGSGIA
ncbi:MAG: DUF3641 domain-containing protein [Terriglobia bacterium]